MSTVTIPNDETADQLFTVLSNARRRYILQALAEHGPLDRGDLVDRVAEYELGEPIDEIENDDRHTVYVSLQQTHLDALEDADVIQRDGDRIEAGALFNDAYRYYETAVDVFTDRSNQSIFGSLKSRFRR